MAYWLFKSEPDQFSIQDLAQRPQQREPWDGVRNYQARNLMRDQMQVGDLGFFYHSNCKPPAIVGSVRVCRTQVLDESAFDPESPYFDPKSSRDHPRWWCVEVELVEIFPRPLPLPWLKQEAALASMPLLAKGQRLSVQPVAKAHWDYLMQVVQTGG